MVPLDDDGLFALGKNLAVQHHLGAWHADLHSSICADLLLLVRGVPATRAQRYSLLDARFRQRVHRLPTLGPRLPLERSNDGIGDPPSVVVTRLRGHLLPAHEAGIDPSGVEREAAS